MTNLNVTTYNLFGLTFSWADIIHLLAPIPNHEMLNGSAYTERIICEDFEGIHCNQ